MKALITLLAVAFLASAMSVSAAAPANDVTGNWSGTLEIGQVKLRIVFKISKSASGALTAKMDSPDQGARDIPVDVVTATDKDLHLELKAIQGVYDGTLNATGKTATGKWKQGPNSLPLVLAKGSGTEPMAEAEKLSPADLAASKLAAQKITGTWNGTLVAGAASLRLRANFTKAATGAATGTLDSLDQGANGIPLSTITIKEGKVRFEAKAIGVVYEGTLAENGANVSGQWQQGGQSLPLIFKKTARP